MARDFNGSTDRLDFSSGIDVSTLSAGTCSMWVRRDAAASGSEYLYNTEDASSNLSLICWISAAIQMTIVRATTNQFKSFTNTITDDEWTNVIFVWTGGTTADSISAYKNNVALSSAGAGDGAGALVATDRHNLGGRSSDDARNYDGKMAEVGFWDIVLNSSQRQMLADGYSPDCVAPGNLVTYNPLVRELEDRATGVSGTADGTAVYEHPRIIRRSANILQFPASAPAASFQAAWASRTNTLLGSGFR